MRREPRRQEGASYGDRVVAMRSPAKVAFFYGIFALSLRRGFNAARLAKGAPAPAADTPRLVIYTNHPSWWDPITYSFVNTRLLGDRPMFSPVEDTMIARYSFLASIGGFGVAQRSVRGALMFLTASETILADARNVLIVACQGRFSDVRERPLRISGGLAHLSERAVGATFVPLAIEYALWEERRPELLLRFGAPVPASTLAGLAVEDRRILLESGLEHAMSALAEASIARDAAQFETLLSGAKGVNPFYDAWRRLKAMARGRSFDPRHGRSA
jgi:1-acyl-sn-glycerol-3-phosphate acyltransferase